MKCIANRGRALLAALALLLTACAAPTAAPSPTPDANMQLTAVQGTVQSELTRAASAVPTATNTPRPTETQSISVTSTLPLASPTTTLIPSATRPAVPDKAEFVSQSIPDNSKFNQGQEFTLMWTMKNVGTSTWSTAYMMRHYAGEQFAAPGSVNFPKEVKPGETVELSVNMRAPLKGGTFQSTWVLTNEQGLNFSSMYLIIEVSGATSTSTSAPVTDTPVPATETPTETPSSTSTT